MFHTFCYVLEEQITTFHYFPWHCQCPAAHSPTQIPIILSFSNCHQPITVVSKATIHGFRRTSIACRQDYLILPRSQSGWLCWWSNYQWTDYASRCANCWMCVGILESYFAFWKNPLPPYPIHDRTSSKLINIYLLNTFHVLTSMVLNPGCLLTSEFSDIIYFLMVNSDATKVQCLGL